MFFFFCMCISSRIIPSPQKMNSIILLRLIYCCRSSLACCRSICHVFFLNGIFFPRLELWVWLSSILKFLRFNFLRLVRLSLWHSAKFNGLFFFFLHVCQFKDYSLPPKNELNHSATYVCFTVAGPCSLVVVQLLLCFYGLRMDQVDNKKKKKLWQM